MNRNARSATPILPPPRPTADYSLVRVNVSPMAHQAVCASCFRHSPIIAGDEANARARVRELGWTVGNQGAVLCCPICANRAAPPTLQRASRRLRRVSGRVEASERRDDGLCDSLPVR